MKESEWELRTVYHKHPSTRENPVYLMLKALPVAEETYLFRVPYYDYCIWFLKKVDLFGYR